MMSADVLQWIVRQDIRIGDKYFPKGCRVGHADRSIILNHDALLSETTDFKKHNELAFLAPIKPGHFGEDDALKAAGMILRNDSLRFERYHRGHVWLAARQAGWLDYNDSAVIRLVEKQHGIAFHLLPQLTPIKEGNNVAILKSLQLTFSPLHLDLWRSNIDGIDLCVKPQVQHRVGLTLISSDIQTSLRHDNAKVGPTTPYGPAHLESWLSAARSRLTRHHQQLEAWTQTPYQPDAIIKDITAQLEQGIAGIIIAGAPSPMAPGDPLSQALTKMKWQQRIMGVPMRPGNHIAYGTIPRSNQPRHELQQKSPWVIVVPRSFRQEQIDHAFDLVLPRILLNRDLSPQSLAGFATMGLSLSAPSIRRQPRRVTTLILAGGYSQRMGFDKRLKPWPGIDAPKSLIVSTILTAQNACDDIRVVIRNNDQAMAQCLRDLDVSVVHAPASPVSLSASLQAGIAALARSEELLLILPCDLPRIMEKSISAVAECLQKNPQRIIRPYYQGQPGHPVGVSYHIAKRWVSLLSGQKGAQPLIESAQTIALDHDHDGIVSDVDTPNEWHDQATISNSQHDG